MQHADGTPRRDADLDADCSGLSLTLVGGASSVGRHHYALPDHDYPPRSRTTCTTISRVRKNSAGARDLD